VSQRLELRLQHGALLPFQVEVVHPLGDRQAIEAGQFVQGE
jgi:hypothetical protein